MLIEQEGDLLVQITAEHLNELISVDDLVIAGWEKEEDIPENRGTVLSVEQGVVMWLGTRGDAYASDRDPQRIKETPRVWLDTESARSWLAMFGGDTTTAVEAINAQIVHDADVNAPDCGARDPEIGFTCTLAAGHGGTTHVAGLGRACIGRVFTGGR